MYKINNREYIKNEGDNDLFPHIGFYIVVPTARDPKWADQNIKSLLESCTYPTLLKVRDGQIKHGKSGVLNREISEFDPERFAFYCTIDDDIKLPENWQHDIIRAFAVLPDYAAFGAWWGDTEEGANYMIERNPIRHEQDIKYMQVFHNIAGAVICCRSKVAKKIGVYPIRPGDERKYQMDEDGWRCARIKQLGHKIGYVVLRGKPELLHAPDSPEYLEAKDRDIKKYLGK